jgi:predicted methyltransferase
MTLIDMRRMAGSGGRGTAILPRLAGFVVAAACFTIALSSGASSVTDRAMLDLAVADPHRSLADRARDTYRHPAETLSFLGVKPEQTVVDFQPGGGWYTAILAPYLGARGHYIALAQSDAATQAKLSALIASGGARYAGARAAGLDFATGITDVAPGSVDLVLTFRNIHNMLGNGPERADTILKALYVMLKPGGILGVEEHRLPEARDASQEATSGYVKQSTVVRVATRVGFCLAGVSEINANPEDTADYPQGVWALPPTLRNGDADRARYLAIGESDRMTLRFIKPERSAGVCPKIAASPAPTKE